MTLAVVKQVFVLPNITGPTGLFEIVNILNTGPTGLAGPTGPAAAGISGPTGGFFPVWAQLAGPNGASGPTGNFKTVCYAGATFRKGLKTVIIPGYSAGGGGGGTTLDPGATLGGHTVLSNANLTATHDGGVVDSGAFSTTSKALGSGKWYMEAKINLQSGGADTGFGFTIAGTTYTQFGNLVQNSVVLFSSGSVWLNGVNQGSGGIPVSTGKVVGILLDMTNHTIQFNDATVGTQGTQFALPGTLGPLFFACNDNAANGQLTANFGASAFTASIPVGYTKWG